MQYSKPKIKNLDLLRILASVSVTVYHLFSKNNLYVTSIPLYETLRYMTRQGRLATDLFFMLAGFFLVYAFKPNVSLLSFIKKRILRFWPVLIFIILCNFILSWFGMFNFSFYKHLITFSGVSSFGFFEHDVSIGRFWFVSALLWVSSVLYYSMLRFDKKKVNVAVTICVIAAYTMLVTMPINFNRALFGQMWHGIISVGMLCAIGGVGLGYLIARWYEKYHIDKTTQHENPITTICFTVLEILAFLATISMFFLYILAPQYNIFAIGILVIMLALLLAKRGWVSRILDTINLSFLSRYAYSLFLCHPFVYIVLKKLLWKPYPNLVREDPVGNLLLTGIAVVIMTLITYHCVEAPAKKWIAKRATK